ncbi:MAG: helix-turn-helix domain-containing protein [Lachnospiraceae bacterium]|nr:helix-turn-helix domain-containing protein [Lachnospiraceae bacterium]
MGTVSYEYLAHAMARLSGIPVRIYESSEERCRFFPAALPKDPLELCREEVLAIREHVGYFATPLFHYYGVLNSGNVKIVIGPTAQIMGDEQQLRELAFRLDVPAEQVSVFTEGMNAIMRLPVETLLQMLCTLNHFLNGGEMLTLSDIAIHEAEQMQIKTGVEQHRTSRVYEEDTSAAQPHNTLAIEEALMGIVRRGDSVALRRWLSSAPAVQGGTIAGDQLRQLRNLFIVTATLTSRAAIRGGMREDDAFSLSDAYIRRAELLTSHSKIQNLQYNMLLEFTEQVEKLRRSGYATKLSLDVANYVRHHLSEPVSVEKMAETFFLSRPYLSSKFRQETGQTLTDFILNEKTEEAKRLLRYSDKPLSAISAYLGFSSHGHFSRVFKRCAGVTPGEYREKYRM